MATPSSVSEMHPGGKPSVAPVDAHASGVAWGAVLAGATAAAALSLLLLILGVGLGLAASSPWSYQSETLGKSAILWITFTQLAAAGIGGYLAGRLRIRWPSVHTDEVYFRDTAHGLLAWALASLLSAGLMAGAMRGVLGGAVELGAGAAQIAAPAVSSLGYFSDTLLRSDSAAPDADNGALRAEVGRVLSHNLSGAALAADDRSYLSSLVAKRARLAPADAERRVDALYARLSKVRADTQTAARAAADKARRAAAYSALWMFVALCLGAFCASVCATLGGRQRDH